MEWLILLAFIFGPALFRILFSEGATAVQRTTVRAQHGPLSIRLGKHHLESESGEGFEYLRVEMKGMNPSFSIPAIGIILLADSEGRPVQCLDHKKQERETIFYQEIVCEEEEVFLFHKDTYFTDWVTIGFVPLPLAIPAEAGVSQLRARLCLHHVVDDDSVPVYRRGRLTSGSSPAKVLESCTCTIDSNYGYLAIEQERRKSILASMRLAVVAAAVDGSVEQGELDIIRDVAKRRVDSVEDSVTFKGDLQNAIRDALGKARSNSSLEELRISAIRDLQVIDSEPLSIEAIELCVEVLAADGVADKSELDFVYDLCNHLAVDKSLVREMVGKKMALEDLAVGQDGCDFGVLGIDASMESSEIRRHLNQAFRKWNSLVHHDNPQTAARAREMLDVIGRARKEFLE
jgi:hypothetical protein